MYLIDTNIWLELFLDQARATEVSDFLDRLPSENLFITDFAFHSMGVVLSRFNRKDALLRFVQDAFLEGAAYQYSAAEKYDLTTVSFDSDFDQTPRGRKTPAEIK